MAKTNSSDMRIEIISVVVDVGVEKFSEGVSYILYS